MVGPNMQTAEARIHMMLCRSYPDDGEMLLASVSVLAWAGESAPGWWVIGPTITPTSGRGVPAALAAYTGGGNGR